MGIPLEGERPPARLPAPVAPLEGVDLGEVVRLEPFGRCPVCSQLVEERAVSCPGCQTDHHEECVQFNGACGVFGCGCGAPVDLNAVALLEDRGRSFVYSVPVRFFRSSPVSYVTLTVGSLLGMLLAVDPAAFLLSLGLPTSYFLLAGTMIAWICQLLLENIERSC